VSPSFTVTKTIHAKDCPVRVNLLARWSDSIEAFSAALQNMRSEDEIKIARRETQTTLKALEDHIKEHGCDRTLGL
jgi:hypothetical protein